MTMKRLKTITSYTGLSRWLAETAEQPIAWLARVQVEHIPSPYCYSPSSCILDWNGRSVVYFETSHKRYEVFEVPAELLRFKSDAEATDWNARFCKPAAPPLATEPTEQGNQFVIPGCERDKTRGPAQLNLW